MTLTFLVEYAADSYLLAGTGTPAAVEIGNVTYTWTGKANALSGTYNATVTMEVEAL